MEAQWKQWQRNGKTQRQINRNIFIYSINMSQGLCFRPFSLCLLFWDVFFLCSLMFTFCCFLVLHPHCYYFLSPSLLVSPVTSSHTCYLLSSSHLSPVSASGPVHLVFQSSFPAEDHCTSMPCLGILCAPLGFSLFVCVCYHVSPVIYFIYLIIKRLHFTQVHHVGLHSN